MKKKGLDYGLLALGAALVAFTVFLAKFSPDTYRLTALQARVLTAIGGALLGTAVPGLVGIEVKGIRAAGALALVVLFFLGAPTPTPIAKVADDKPSGNTYVKSPVCVGNNCTQDTHY